MIFFVHRRLYLIALESQAEIDDYYKSDVERLLLSHDLVPSLSGFFHAYSLVCSRAFLVDAYHGLCMVPVADASVHCFLLHYMY